METLKITKKELLQTLDDSFNNVETVRHKGLEDMAAVQTIKNRTLEKEKIKLEKKYGADHPRVKKIADRLEYNQIMFQGLDAEIQNAKIRIPDLEPDAWMVYGVVRDSQGGVVEGLTVGLFNEKGKWVRELKHTCTNENGYFSIKYPPEGKEWKTALETLDLNLRVLKGNRNVLYSHPEIINVIKGNMKYVPVYLPEPGKQCSAPEPTPGEEVGPLEDWVVTGKVTDQEGTPQEGVLVSLYDKDLIFDDYLGTQKTGDSGEFKFIYLKEGFRDLFEKKPDIYLKVFDKLGETVYTTKKAVKFNVGRTEVFNVKIKSKPKKA